MKKHASLVFMYSLAVHVNEQLSITVYRDDITIQKILSILKPSDFLIKGIDIVLNKSNILLSDLSKIILSHNLSKNSVGLAVVLVVTRALAYSQKIPIIESSSEKDTKYLISS